MTHSRRQKYVTVATARAGRRAYPISPPIYDVMQLQANEMPMPRWDDLHELFENEDDGKLRDIYVLDTTERDWDRLLRHITTSGWAHSYTQDGEADELPTSVTEIFRRRRLHHQLLVVEPARDLRLTTHFFVVSRIEFDLAMHDVVGQAALDQVCEFMRVVGDVLSKPVRLTPESAPETPLMRYDPRVGVFTVD